MTNISSTVTLTTEELIELLKKESDTSINAGVIIALESLEESLKDWRFNLVLRLFPGFVLRNAKKRQDKEVSQ
jgi:hypothetical protein